jgi:TonB family protein
MAVLNPNDKPHHLHLALIGSLVANLLLWTLLGQGSMSPAPTASRPELVFNRIEVARIQRPHRVRLVEPPKLKTPAPPVVKPIPQSAPTTAPSQDRRIVQPPTGGRTHILEAKAPPRSTDSPQQTAPTGQLGPGILPAGNSPSSTSSIPSTHNGKSTTAPEAPTAPAPAPTVAAPTLPASKPKAVESPPPAPPPPPPPPKPKGATREAQPDHQESVEIPDSLKSQSFKSFVRVRINVSADGSFTVTLRTSSGNPDVDKLVTDTLKKWTWKPALKDGDSVDSVQQFRFNFSVE